jgi:glucose-6-phosphate 1-epimerase
MHSSLQPFLIPGRVELFSGEGGFPCLRLRASGGSATVYVHGAHVTDFVPEGKAPVLWMSRASVFADGKPIRGGIPICWPWFGPHATDAARPAHGFARLRAWTPLDSSVLHDGRVRLRLGFQPEGAETALLPASLRVEMTLTVGAALELQLCSINDGPDPVVFEDALHTYFAVGDLAGVAVSGLEEKVYIDRMDQKRSKIQQGLIRFTAETDRVYEDRSACTEIIDEAGGRRIRIEKSGSASTVVWNPWIAKAKAMPDFGDEEWKEMCCVESANVGSARVPLLPGNRHETRVRISVA